MGRRKMHDERTAAALLDAAERAFAEGGVEALSVRRLAGADVGLATTGIAGPGGATPSKPVGLAFVAAVDAERTMVREHRWQGERGSNRQASAQAALRLTLEMLR